jgi:signal transduction histidine kinase
MGRLMSVAGGDVAVVRSLRRSAPAIPPDTLGKQVARLFEEDRAVPAFAVLRGRSPVGLIDRLGFMSRFAARYGRDLFGNKPITQMMDRDPLIVDAALTVDAVSRRLFTQKPKALHTGFIVTEDGAYAGIVTGIDLLQAVAHSLATTNEHLREAQASLVQSEKMAALGALVAGVAHEINTPIGSALTAATAFGERAKSFGALAGGGSIRRTDIDRFVGAALEASDYMQANIRRASELITGFKQIAVDQTSDERRPFRLAQCLDDVMLSLNPRLRKEAVAVVLSCPPDLELDSYPGAVAQVLTNLVMNAVAHAFGPAMADDYPRRVTVTVAPLAGDALELVVADNGGGVPADVQPRVFDPFFTTRRGQGGTGLGLHIVYNLLAQRLGGGIRVEDAEGGGARFVAWLPLVAP